MKIVLKVSFVFLVHRCFVEEQIICFSLSVEVKLDQWVAAEQIGVSWRNPKP